jgi:predicted transcriptional regulator of viral defense system
VALKRWVAGGVVERVAQNIYLPMGSLISMETLAAQLYLPNYLSFESALAGYGVLNLIPYTMSFATPRKSKRYLLRKQEVEFRQIARDLFFGFEMKNGIYIASPEKAFLDGVYFLARGKVALDFDEIDIKKLSTKRLKEYSKRFPLYVRSQIESILSKQ